MSTVAIMPQAMFNVLTSVSNVAFKSIFFFSPKNMRKSVWCWAPVKNADNSLAARQAGAQTDKRVKERQCDRPLGSGHLRAPDNSLPKR